MTLINNMLEFQVYDLEIYVDEAVYAMVNAHDNGNNDDFKMALEDYEKCRNLVRIGRSMIAGGLEEWDLKWAFDTGSICKHDFNMLEEEFLKLGITREDYDKKWKGVLNGKAPVSKTGTL